MALRHEYFNIPFRVFSLKVIAENCSKDCPSFQAVILPLELLICLVNANVFNILLLFGVFLGLLPQLLGVAPEKAIKLTVSLLS